MELKRIGASLATTLVALPLVACGSGSTPVVTTVTATPAYPTYSSPCPLGDGFDKCMDTRRAERQAADAARPSARPSSSSNPAQSKHDDGGLPWWAWLLIVPVGLVAMGALAIKLMEANDERTIARANARVDELDARHRTRFGDDDDDEDVEDYPDDDDELDEEDMAFLRKATEPVAAPVTPAPPAAGNLLSSLRNQGGAQ